MIFCIEDDNSIRELVIYALASSGFKAVGFTDGESMFEELLKPKFENPELILLDVMLPGKDGITILKELKKDPKTKNIPIIMASAKGTEYDKVVGLDLGADDYLAKPFGMMEMISRVKAVLRRSVNSEKVSVLQIGDITMNKSAHRVEVSGTQVALTLKEYELLETFMNNPGTVFTREQLLDTVWGCDFIGETRTVDVHVGTLRMKLGVCGEYISTVRGVGYKLEKER